MLEAVTCEGCGREIWTAPGVEPCCGRCLDARPSPAELEHWRLTANPRASAAYAREAREAWERDNVVWFHGFADGRAVWRAERPPPDASSGGGASTTDGDGPDESQNFERFPWLVPNVSSQA